MDKREKGQEEIYAERLGKANRTALNCYLIMVTVLAVTYLAETLFGVKSPAYLLVVLAAGYGPVLLALFFYKRNKTHPMVKHLVPYGYSIVYMIIMFTSDNQMAFAYVIPMLIAITVYNDVRYNLKIGAAVIAVNIIHVIVFCQRNGLDAAQIASAEIQLAVLIAIVAFLGYTAKVSFRMNHAEITRAEEEKTRSQELTGKVLQISAEMTQIISQVSAKISVLGDAIQSTGHAMNELAGGTGDTANAVQDQLTQTEVISEKLSHVKGASGQIAGNLVETQEVLSAGNEYVEHLVEQVAQTEQTNTHVASELGQLKEHMEQMFSILEMINQITSQTSLLSLNASIEAARAGEAGRGFAVVASEISSLASQTKGATVKIEELIRNVSNEIGKVVDMIENMIKQVKRQNETVGETARSFEKISVSAKEIESNSNHLTYAVGDLEEANRAISDSIQTISAISEQVASQTNATHAACVENEKIIQQLIEEADELTQMANQLQACE
ncbi:MAG: methyl-accepting chemotaxis protein [Lachnospiraceae bacterium]|nr:methyl-accepting chemotaxis protein [Lachnospiraceae bacterium]